MWDLREVHALYDGEGWVWNESFHHKNVFVDDGDILELQLKDSGEPVLAMMMAE